MTIPNKKEINNESIPEGVYDISRKVLLAAVGAAAIAQEEISGFVNQLTERGELAEKDARGLLKEILDHREKVIQEKREEIKRRTKNTATKADVDELKAKIIELNKQIEDLKKS